jgi:uncharacterized protein (TIGR03437 family)
MKRVLLNTGIAICLLIFTAAFLRDATSLGRVQALEARRISEIRINSGPFDDNQSPSIAVLTDGRFIVGWHEGVPTTCLGRVFSREGSPVAGPFILNPFTSSAWKYGPALAPLPDGGFATFWGHSFGARGQRFDNRFSPTGGDFLFENIGETWPVITALANGDVVAVGDHQFDPYPVIAKRYNSSLVPQGPATQVNVNPPGIRLFTSAIAGAPNGNYTVAWYNSSGDIIARSFNSSGNPLGGEFKVNSSTGGARYQPSLAYNSRNELVIVWYGKGDGDQEGIYARRFRSDNTPLGAEWQVNQTAAGSQYYANVAIGGNDEIVISWTSATANESDVFARLYGADLTPIGAEFRVNQFTSGGQRTPVFGGRRGNAIIGNQLVFTWTGSGQQGVGVYMTIFSVSDIAQPATCISSPSGLVSWWPAEGNANDIRNSNNGRPEGGVGYAVGQVGQAFSFDGTGHVRVANNANLNVQTLTIEAWIRTGGTTDAALAGFIVAKSGVDGLSGYDFAIGRPSQNGVLRFTLNGGAGGADLLGTTSVTNNAFHHVATTYDGTTMKIYVDGNLDAQKAVSLTINYPPDRPLMIGKREYSLVPGPFQGLIDEVAFYNRALSASEIQSIFNAGRFGKCSVTIVSAASFMGPMLAPDSIVAAFGADLATSTRIAPPVLPLPTELAGTTVKVTDSTSAVRSAWVFFVSPNQVNFHMPSGTAIGAASVAITNANGLVSYGAVQISSVAPGLFSANANGQGVAAAIIVRVKPDGTQIIEPVARFDPALNRFVSVPIDLGPETDQVFLIPFGTGFRSRSSLGAVTVRVGGAEQQVLYAGETPGFVGLDQLNVRLSRSLIGRGEVDVVLTVDGRTANIVRVNIK